MKKQTEAMKLALEALLWANDEINGWRDDAYGYEPEDQPVILSAINALREALAEQPAQQEPVAVPDCGEAGHDDGACGNRECLPSFRRSTTSPQPAQQEPVGEVKRYGLDPHGRQWHGIYWYHPNVDVPHGTKLYTSPPAKQEADAIVTSLTAGPDGVARSGLDRELPLMAGVYLAPQPAQQEPDFFTHNVEQPYDWSEWVCPDPKGYLMKCCDCGLVHEAEFGVVRYKSETEREDCEPVEYPNLQAVFRMRRSEQWSPADTAHMGWADG